MAVTLYPSEDVSAVSWRVVYILYCTCMLSEQYFETRVGGSDSPSQYERHRSGWGSKVLGSMRIICRRAVLEGSGASGAQRFTKVRLLVDERACTSVGEQESLSKANSL